MIDMSNLKALQAGASSYATPPLLPAPLGGVGGGGVGRKVARLGRAAVGPQAGRWRAPSHTGVTGLHRPAFEYPATGTREGGLQLRLYGHRPTARVAPLFPDAPAHLV